MHASLAGIALLLVLRGAGGAEQRGKQGACERAVIEGEVTAGQSFTQAFGGGLQVFLQPIHSGWILRVLPAAGPAGAHDYAELATPPYDSVTPLSISTDFAFRAQDAVGWNPRRFHFASSAAAFRTLEQAWVGFEQAGAGSSAALLASLSRQVSRASAGTLTMLDARLIPGTADQSRLASPVALHFAGTAHTLVAAADGSSSLLGRIVWMRFMIELDVPRGFALPRERVGVRPGLLRFVPRSCGSE